MNKTSLLELAKRLNIPRQKCMKTKEELEEAIKDTITSTKIIFGSDNPACMGCPDELRKQQIINQKIYDQRLIEATVRKLAWMVTRRLIREQVRCWVLRLIPHIGKTNFRLIL